MFNIDVVARNGGDLAFFFVKINPQIAPYMEDTIRTLHHDGLEGKTVCTPMALVGGVLELDLANIPDRRMVERNCFCLVKGYFDVSV